MARSRPERPGGGSGRSSRRGRPRHSSPGRPTFPCPPGQGRRVPGVRPAPPVRCASRTWPPPRPGRRSVHSAMRGWLVPRSPPPEASVAGAGRPVHGAGERRRRSLWPTARPGPPATGRSLPRKPRMPGGSNGWNACSEAASGRVAHSGNATVLIAPHGLWIWWSERYGARRRIGQRLFPHRSRNRRMVACFLVSRSIRSITSVQRVVSANGRRRRLISVRAL